MAKSKIQSKLKNKAIKPRKESTAPRIRKPNETKEPKKPRSVKKICDSLNLRVLKKNKKPKSKTLLEEVNNSINNKSVENNQLDIILDTAASTSTFSPAHQTNSTISPVVSTTISSQLQTVNKRKYIKRRNKFQPQKASTAQFALINEKNMQNFVNKNQNYLNQIQNEGERNEIKETNNKKVHHARITIRREIGSKI